MKNFLGSTVILAVFLDVSKGDSQWNENCPKSGELLIKNKTTLFVDLGSDVILNCFCSNQSKSTFTGPAIPSLMGNQHVQSPYTDGYVLNPNINKTKFKVVSSTKNNECNLKILNFSREEDGIYQCQYTIMDKITIHEFNVAIKRPPSNLEILNLTDKNVMTWRAGQPLTLVCKVQSGIPLEKLQWSYNGTTLKEGGPGNITYSFVPSKIDNMQLLTCSAINPLLLQPLTKELYLNITYKPCIKILVKPQNVNFTEGRNGMICCEVQSNPPGFITMWLNNYRSLQRKNGNKKCIEFSPFLRKDSGHFTCVAKNKVGTSRLSTELKILYPPKVTVKYTCGPNYIDFTCNAAGEPNRYIFSQWVHESEFHKLIRLLTGTRLGTLRVYRTKNPLKQYEDSGYYICRVSNGIPDIEGNYTQEGKAVVTIEGPPVYLLENTNLHYGTFGHDATLCLQIYSDTGLLSKRIRRNHAENDLESSIQEETVKGHIMFHGVKVMVSGTKIKFKIHMETAEDFNNYTIIICNRKECNNMTLEVRSSALKVTFEKFSAVKLIIAIIVVAVLVSVVACLVFRKKIGTCATKQDLSDVDFSHEETQDTSVENQLYQLAEPVEFINERGRGRAMFRPMDDLQMPNHDRNLVADLELPNSLDISRENSRDLAEGEHVQINEPNLNYADVMFYTKPKTNTIVVHRKEDKTIYSEIDHLKRAEALHFSSESESDSDDDFMYIDDIQNFLGKNNV